VRGVLTKGSHKREGVSATGSSRQSDGAGSPADLPHLWLAWGDGSAAISRRAFYLPPWSFTRAIFCS